MTVNQKVSGTAKTIPAGLAAGWGVQMIIVVISCVMLALLIRTGKMEGNGLGYGVMATLLLASYMGSLTSCRMVQTKKMAVCAVSGILLFATLMLAMVLLFDGKLDAAAGVTALLIAGGSAAGGIETNRRRGPKRKNRHKRI